MVIDEVISSTTGTRRSRAHKSASHQIRSDHIRSDHIRSHQITSDQIRSHQITSDQIRSDHIRSDHIRSDHIRSDHIRSDHITSDQIRSDPQRFLSRLPTSSGGGFLRLFGAELLNVPFLLQRLNVGEQSSVRRAHRRGIQGRTLCPSALGRQSLPLRLLHFPLRLLLAFAMNLKG